MTIYLIRHGKTEANEGHLYCGSTDLPLSQAGREALGELHYSVGHVRFVTSGMKRTDETLRVLFGDVPYETDPRFREIDFGVFEMRSFRELKDDPDYQIWIAGDNEANVPPKGESGRQMEARVLEAFFDIREDTVIITHGGVIAAIMEHLFPEENKNRYDWQPLPGHGYVVTQGRYQAIGKDDRSDRSGAFEDR
ncbi:MAG: histidine phosphatase family protein [Oscillospiraceae bacterium]|nr:histidine phosphatase family protein [Oscillospiraceae bacterium]